MSSRNAIKSAARLAAKQVAHRQPPKPVNFKPLPAERIACPANPTSPRPSALLAQPRAGKAQAPTLASGVKSSEPPRPRTTSNTLQRIRASHWPSPRTNQPPPPARPPKPFSNSHSIFRSMGLYNIVLFGNLVYHGDIIFGQWDL
jgi:hypothetical protein